MRERKLLNHVDRRTVLKTGSAISAASVTGLSGLASAQSNSEYDIVVDAGGSGDFQTIQAAVNNADPGDSIRVLAGVYEEAVVIDRPVTLVGNSGGTEPGAGSNPPVLDGGSGLYHAFNLEEGVEEVRIEGFEIRNYKRNAVRAWNRGTSDVKVHNNTIENVRNGLLVGGNPGAGAVGVGPHEEWSIERNNVRAFDFIGLELHNLRDSGVRENFVEVTGGAFGSLAVLANATDVEEVLISGNTLTGMYDAYGIGIVVFRPREGSEPVTVSDIVVRGNDVDGEFGGSGIGIFDRVDGSAPGVMKDISVSNNNVTSDDALVGIGIEPFSEDTIIKKLDVGQNTVAVSPAGIGMRSRANGGTLEDILIVANEVSDADVHAMSLHAFSEIGPVEYKGNKVHSNREGILLEGTAPFDATFKENEFFDNETTGLVADQIVTGTSLEIKENQFTDNQHGAELTFGDIDRDVSIEVKEH